jgi:hypothetical protein
MPQIEEDAMSCSRDLHNAHFQIKEGVEWILRGIFIERDEEEAGIESVISAVSAAMTDDEFRLLQRLIQLRDTRPKEANGDRCIQAYYTCELPDQRDEQIKAIFEAHGGDYDGSGYDFTIRQREHFAMVPVDRAEACIAALITAGFRVENIALDQFADDLRIESDLDRKEELTRMIAEVREAE